MGIRKRGVLLLADIVGYTSQANKLGQAKTEQFLENYESKIETITRKYNANFIKRSGDAVLIFIEDEEESLKLMEELRKNSKDRIFDSEGMQGVLRIVSHLGKFNFKTAGEKMVDVVDPEAIKLFRIEKFAKSYEVVLTSTLYDLLEENLKDKNISNKYLGTYELKGFSYPVILFKLIFPGTETINPQNILNKEMKKLEAKTKEIPIFGNIYPPVSMEKNFLNLHISVEHLRKKAADGDGNLEWYPGDVENFEVMPANGSRDSVNVKVLYEGYQKGVIFGLPGSGKTTILNYFAYRELKKNRDIADNESKRVVLLIECRNMISCDECPNTSPYSGDEKHRFDIETILHYFTYIFLFGSKRKKKQAVDEIDNYNLREAGELVIRAYNNGRLSLLIDALDESENTMIKNTVVDFLETLLIDSYDEKKKAGIVKGGNLIFLTSRYNERQNYFTKERLNTFYPIIEVRLLDMEQLREMAEHFYGTNSNLYKEFDEIVWKEEIAAKVGGTPLTALLVLAYFKIFKQLDTRYFMYDLLITFMLIRAWDQIKRGDFKKDMNVFFRLAKEKVIFNEDIYKDAGEVYEALTFLSYSYTMGKTASRHMQESTLHSVLREFGKDSQVWIKRLEEDHILVHAGPMEYVFIHFTVMDYLAARFLVNKLNNPDYLKKFNCEIDFHGIQTPVFESETLPIAAGSDIKTGAKLLELLRGHIEKIKDEKERHVHLRAALKSLVEYESLILRRMNSAEIPYFIEKIEKEVMENIGSVEWVYRYLKKALLQKDKIELESIIETFNNISKLSMSYFLDNYMTYKEIAEGDSEMMSLRKQLLYKLINKNLVDEWFNKHEIERTDASLKREKQQIKTSDLNLTVFNSKIYNPEDKNFPYYQKVIGKELVGFLGSPNLKHSKSVSCLLVTGKKIISGANDGTVKLWNIENGKELQTFKGHERGIVNLAISGKTIISGSSDGIIKLWDMDNGKEVCHYETPVDQSRCIAATGETIISGASDGTIRLWDMHNGSEILTYKGHDDTVTCLKVQGNLIVSCGNDGNIKLWDMEKKIETGCFKGEIEGVGIRCITIDGNMIAAGASDGTIKLWDMESGKNIQTINGHDKAVNGIAVSGNRIISGGDTSIKLWNIEKGEELYSLKAHSFWVTCLAVSGKTIVSAGGDAAIKLWDLESGTELRSFNRHTESINSIAVTDQTVVSGASDTTIKIWDINEGRDTHTFRGHNRSISSVEIVENMIISGSMDCNVKIWDKGSGKEIRTLKGHTSWIGSIALKDKRIVSGADDGTIKLWNKENGKEIHSFKAHNGKVNCLAMDDKFIISGSSDSIVKLWDVENCEEVYSFKGHEKSINCTAVEGKNIISGANDNTIKLWDIETHKEVRSFKGHKKAVNSIVIKGKNIFSAANDSTIKMWDIESGKCLKTIELPWIPLDIKYLPKAENRIATANGNGTITFFDFNV